MNTFSRFLIPLLMSPALACAPTEASFDETSAAVWRGPATHDASLVSHNIPATMRAGERLNVRVTVENTGASSPTDDWSAAEYYLRGAPGFPFGLKNKVIPQDAAVGESVDIDFVITAPAAGANSVDASMFRSGATGGEFGEAIQVPVTIDAVSTPRWACTLVTPNPPAIQLAPGETREIELSVRNDGLAPWAAGDLCLRRSSTSDDLGARACTGTTEATNPGETLTQTLTVTAPLTAGTYQLQRQMFGLGRPSADPAPYGSGIGFFSSAPCVDLAVEVSGAPQYFDAAVVSQSFPTSMTEGESAMASVTVENNGTMTWNAGEIVLRYASHPTLRIGNAIVDTDVAPGASFTFDLDIRALPVAANGSVDYAFELYKNAAPKFAFGAEIQGSIIIADYAVDATLVSENFPRTMAPGETATVLVEMRNDGANVWPASSTRLRSLNNPLREWGLVQAVLQSDVAPGATVTVEIEVTAPATAGDYSHAWGMYLHTFFGELIDIPVTVQAAAPSTYTLTVVSNTSMIIDIEPVAGAMFSPSCPAPGCQIEVEAGAWVYLSSVSPYSRASVVQADSLPWTESYDFLGLYVDYTDAGFEMDADHNANVQWSPPVQVPVSITITDGSLTGEYIDWNAPGPHQPYDFSCYDTPGDGTATTCSRTMYEGTEILDFISQSPGAGYTVTVTGNMFCWVAPNDAYVACNEHVRTTAKSATITWHAP